MLDEFDYKEPACPLCDGKDFYYPKKDAPLGRIPVGRIIDKLDSYFNKNDYESARRHLVYWKNEAVALRDERGELAVENEFVGYYRKQGEKENGLSSVRRALELIDRLDQGDTVSGATILINCATAYKAFDMPDAALPLYVRAEEIYNESLNSGDPLYGALYNNMALTLTDLGDFEKAEKSYFSALEIMQNSPRGESEAAITYVNLAHLYESFGKKDKINGCMEKAYELLQCDSLPHDGYYAFVLEKCAPSFGYFGFEHIYKELKAMSEEIYAGT